MCHFWNEWSFFSRKKLVTGVTTFFLQFFMLYKTDLINPLGYTYKKPKQESVEDLWDLCRVSDLSVLFSGSVKVWDPRQKNDPVATMEPSEGQARRDCWTVAFGQYQCLLLTGAYLFGILWLSAPKTVSHSFIQEKSFKVVSAKNNWAWNVSECCNDFYYIWHQ